MQTVMYVGLEKYCEFDFLLASLRSDNHFQPESYSYCSIRKNTRPNIMLNIVSISWPITVLCGIYFNDFLSYTARLDNTQEFDGRLCRLRGWLGVGRIGNAWSLYFKFKQLFF